MALASASALGDFLILMGAMVRFSSTVLLGNRLKCWNTMPIFCRCRGRSTFFPVMSTPLNRMEPEVGVSSRFRLRRNVLLPHRDDVALVHVRRYTVQRLHIAAVVILFQIVYLDQLLCHQTCTSRCCFRLRS